MVTIADKADHVRRAKQTRRHACHWPGCEKQVPPAMWGCKQHWYMLPRQLRVEVWRTYRPGQEEDGKPSGAYVRVAMKILAWIKEQERIGRMPGKVRHVPPEEVQK